MPGWFWNVLSVLVIPGALFLARLWSDQKTLRQKVLGLTGDNGMSGDVNALAVRMREMERWREDFRAELPDLLAETRHDAVDKMTALYSKLEDRVDQIEQRRRPR